MESERYCQELFSHRKYSDGKRLEKYGFKVYSQSDEDGIIQEIFDRIGVGSRTFVEFGVDNYQESNTRFLLTNNKWRGLVIDGNQRHPPVTSPRHHRHQPNQHCQRPAALLLVIAPEQQSHQQRCGPGDEYGQRDRRPEDESQ